MTERKNAVFGAHYLDANILSESPQLSNDLARLFQMLLCATNLSVGHHPADGSFQLEIY